MKRYVDADLILDPGSLRHQIAFQVPNYNKGDSGEDVPDWMTTVQTRGCFNSIKAKKFFASDRENVEKVYPVEMRWQTGIEATMQMLYAARTFEVLTVVDVEERHRVLYLQVRELT